MTEHEHQVKLFQMAKEYEHKYPELKRLFAIPNGGKRSKIIGAKLKAEGVKRGVPDICLPVARGGYHGLFIELKKEGGKATKEQKEWIHYLIANDYHAVVVNGYQSAWETIVYYLEGVI